MARQRWEQLTFDFGGLGGTPCAHPNWWFDRTIMLCGPYCDERMHYFCEDCGAPDCDVPAPADTDEDE